MAVDHEITATSESEVNDSDDLSFVLKYSLPFDVYQKSGFWGGVMLGKSGGFETELHSMRAVMTAFDGSFALGKFRHCMFNMSPFELVNEHQWSGSQPTQLTQWSKGAGEYKIGSERPLWGISGFDAARGERILAGLAHGDKDSVLTVQYRLNMMIDYVRGLIKPYENEVRDNFKEKRVVPEGTPETHPEQHEMMAELLNAYRQSKPHWEF